jgi:colicin import membrane protein
MSNGILDIPKSNDGSAADPFRLGFRYVDRDGIVEQVGLTEWDLLHPKDGDFFVQTQHHHRIVSYLFVLLTETLNRRPASWVVSKQVVDWGVEEIGCHGVDIAIFDDMKLPCDLSEGIFTANRYGAHPTLVVEVTSPATRKNDLGIKVDHYFEVGIPYYLIVDFDNSLPQLIAYRRARNGYVPIPADPAKGIWIPSVQLWFRVDGDRVLLFDADGRKIPDMQDRKNQLNVPTQKWEHEKQRAVHAKQLADHEKQRADHEKQRADHEKQRADALQSELEALKARLNSATTHDNPETDHHAD